MNKAILFSIVSMVNEHQGIRLDDRATAMISQQLEYVKAQTYDIKYPALKARTLIPVSNEVPAGAKTFTYYQWDAYGMARVVANYADDIPLVNVVRRAFTAQIKHLASAYQFSVMDLASAALGRESIDTRLAAAARRSIEAGMDEVAAFGLEDANIRGFVNHPNVPVVLPTTGDWANPATTATQILADLAKLASSIPKATDDVFHPDTMVFDIDTFELLNSKVIGAEYSKTVLRAFLDSNAHIRNIEVWNKLDLADATGEGPRAICYLRDPEVLQLEIPLEFTQMPQEARNLAFVVNCYAGIGGTSIRYPLAIAYMDGI